MTQENRQEYNEHFEFQNTITDGLAKWYKTTSLKRIQDRVDLPYTYIFSIIYKGKGDSSSLILLIHS